MKIRALGVLVSLAMLLQVVSCKKADVSTSPDQSKNHSGGVNPVQYYTEVPDVANCFAGLLSDGAKTEVLDYVNSIRALHGLLPVSYDKKYDINVQNAALLIVANDKLTHSPATSSFCYTNEGADGSAKSNLSYGYGDKLSPRTNKSVIDSWMTEINNLADVVGHRRWILDPFLKKISFGRTEGTPKNNNSKWVNGFALYVMNPEQYQNISALKNDFVAYPYDTYPVNLFNKDCYLSFTAIANKTDKWANKDVNYSNAIVKVFNGQTEIPVLAVSHDNGGYGVPNAIQWKLGSFKTNTIYTVKISNVFYKGTARNYEYTFNVKS